MVPSKHWSQTGKVERFPAPCCDPEFYDVPIAYTALSWFGESNEHLSPDEKIFRDYKNRLLLGRV